MHLVSLAAIALAACDFRQNVRCVAHHVLVECAEGREVCDRGRAVTEVAVCTKTSGSYPLAQEVLRHETAMV
jgi:hypothetical protein